MPEGCTFAKVVKIAYTASVTTAEVLTGCNPLLGTTGAAGATPITLFDFPRPTDEPSSSGRKRKRATAASVQSTPAVDDPEEGEEEDETEAGPSVTISHDRQLKKADNQCFCGKGNLTLQKN